MTETQLGCASLDPYIQIYSPYWFACPETWASSTCRK